MRSLISTLQKNKIKVSLIACASFFLLFTRLWHLADFPAALTHDEVVYAIQAQSFAVQGTTVNQQFHWWSLQPVHPDYAEFPALLMTVFFKFISNPLLATRMISVIMGISFPFILAMFSFGLWKNKRLSSIVFLVSIVNPLLWQMSRLTYDAVMSTYFYLIGGTIILLFKDKRSLVSILFLVIGFFCYQGDKLVFLPWVLLLAILQFNSVKELVSQKYFLFIVLFCSCLFATYILLILPHQKIDNRWSNTIFANTDFQAKVTNEERRVAIANKLSPIFSNKAVVVGKFLGERFIEAYSPTFLFVYGEPAQSAFSAWGYGWFHYFEGALLLLGVFFLLSRQKFRKSTLFIVGFLAIATIPATINSGDPWFLLRMFLPNTLLILLISAGSYFLTLRFKWGKYAVIALYMLGTFSFMYHYYYRYPISGLNLSYFSERIMAEYVQRSLKANPERKIIVYTIDPAVLFWTYLIYTNGMTAQNAHQIAEQKDIQEISFGNITFTTDCVDLGDENTLILSEANRSAVPCDHDKTHFPQQSKDQFQKIVDSEQSTALTIPSVIDNGAYWRVYNNQLCDKKFMKGYVTVDTFNDLNPSGKSDQDLCQKWLSTAH